MRSVDHDLRDGRIRQQPLERPVAEDVVRDLGSQPFAVVPREACFLLELRPDLGLDPRTDGVGVRDIEEPGAELAHQPEMDAVLQVGEWVGRAAVDAAHGGARLRKALVELHYRPSFLRNVRRRFATAGSGSVPLPASFPFA